MVNFKELSVGDKVETFKGFNGIVTAVYDIPSNEHVVSVDYNTCSGIHRETYYDNVNTSRLKWNIFKVFKNGKNESKEEVKIEQLSKKRRCCNCVYFEKADWNYMWTNIDKQKHKCACPNFEHVVAHSRSRCKNEQFVSIV